MSKYCVIAVFFKTKLSVLFCKEQIEEGLSVNPEILVCE